MTIFIFNVILLGISLLFDKMTLGFAASSNFDPLLGVSFCKEEDSAVIGTSVRRSSWSAFGRPTGNDVSSH